MISVAPVVQATTNHKILQATLTKPVHSPGVVGLGMTKWRCRGVQCRAKVKSTINLLNACIALVRKAGSVKRFGFVQPVSNKGKATRTPNTKLAANKTQVINGATLSNLAIVRQCNQTARNTGRDMLTTHLQSEIQSRSQDITSGTRMMRNINDSRSAILRNIR